MSRNEALRSMALKYEREKREAEQKLKSEREARLGIGLWIFFVLDEKQSR